MRNFSLREVILFVVVIALAVGWATDRVSGFSGRDAASTTLAIGISIAWWIDRKRLTKKPPAGTRAHQMTQIYPGIYSDVEVDMAHQNELERLKQQQNSN